MLFSDRNIHPEKERQIRLTPEFEGLLHEPSEIRPFHQGTLEIRGFFNAGSFHPVGRRKYLYHDNWSSADTNQLREHEEETASAHGHIRIGLYG